MRRRFGWRWRCLICGHREYDQDGLDAVESYEKHYMKQHMTKEGR